MNPHFKIIRVLPAAIFRVNDPLSGAGIELSGGMMQKISIFFAMFCVIAAQSTAPLRAQDAPATSAILVPGAIVLKKDTPVRLMVMTEVSTKVDGVGHRFRLSVDEPVMIGDTVVIPEGTIAWGEVTSAQQSGNVGKTGALSARLLYIDLPGNRIAITGETQARGKNGSDVAIAILSLGIGGLFSKGNNAKIKAGERMTAFTAEDQALVPVVVAHALPKT